MRTLKTIAVTVEFDLEVPKDVEGEDITFSIPLEQIVVHGLNGPIIEASAKGYTTQQYIEDF
jgi:hypothetical protein